MVLTLKDVSVQRIKNALLEIASQKILGLALVAIVFLLWESGLFTVIVRVVMNA